MTKIRLTVGAGMLALFALTPCCLMTRDEGRVIERDLRTTQDELAELRQQQQQIEQERVAQLDRLNSALTQADETGRRADADFFLKMDGLVQQVQQLSGRVEELEHRLSEIEARQARPPASSLPAPIAAEAGSQPTAAVGSASTPAAPPLPTDKKELYDLGKKALDSGKYEESRRIMRHFLGKFPDDATLSDNALFWIGEGYFKESSFDKAILTFQEVINKYPRSDKLDAALYKIGRSFEALGLKDDALLFYEDLVAKYPKSTHVSDAKKRVQALKKPDKKGGRDKKKSKPARRTG
ncbi:MAG: tol-pal system protein YbgF [Deltaproteobacteria bacterium]|nr:tol-pal system protein YbgF [Deltaproteobacteria bacterium]